ncbi:L-asparaginase II [Leucobacter exalbidus]|uniref:L-asparaginase II n=1 Tax=Leucobacter exalbidus TaxID=662960 RepID=A0A940PKM0_9MICO|nr:L-asparaginase II [Leucobacter exalbidus]
MIESTIAELTGESSAAATTDGCGTPLFAYSLRATALSYARLVAAAPESPEGRVAAAMQAHPDLVGGEDRDVTAMMRAVPGLVAKDGAEAVQLMGLKVNGVGIGVAVKISDGGDRARLPISAGILRALGVPADALATLPATNILGGGRPVGELRATAAATAVLEELTRSAAAQTGAK